MFEGIKNGAGLISASFKSFRQYPILLLPIFLVWLVYAPLIIYFKWHFNWELYNSKAQFAILFLIIYFLAFILSISCSILLELIQQKETGKKFNLLKATLTTFSHNVLHLIILSLVWSIFWFLLVVLKVLTKNKNRGTDEENAENVARTLSGSNDSSGLSFSIDAFLKAIRMVVFLIIPAFAWESKDITQSFSRGFEILRDRKAEFISGFTLSLGVEFLIFLPPGIMFYLSSKGVEFPEWSWFVCIFYVGLAWSYSIYLEQMFAAELYLWQMAYEKEVIEWTKKYKENVDLDEEYPKFSKIRRPSLIDNIPDLKI